MMAQIFVKGFRAGIQRRLLCFNLFWHVLDIIWVAMFTIVYLDRRRAMSVQSEDHTALDVVPGAMDACAKASGKARRPI